MTKNQFLLDHPSEEGLVRVGFQLPMPKGVTLMAHLNAMEVAQSVADPNSVAYWRAARTYPHQGPEQGYFAGHAMAHHVLADRFRPEVSNDIGENLRTAGFTCEYDNTWSRKARCGRLQITVVDEGLNQGVHLGFNRRGSRFRTNLMRLMLSRVGGTGTTVHAVWPTRMASLLALVQCAIEAADFADATGLTGPKRARRTAA